MLETDKVHERTESDLNNRGLAKAEVDFVVQTDRGITPIQITVSAPQARHEDALAEFYKEFPHAANEALFVTPDLFE